MKNKLTVIDVYFLKSIKKIIFDVMLDIEYCEIGDVFVSKDGEEFKIIGFSTEPTVEKNRKSILVQPTSDYNRIEEFKDKEYEKRVNINE